MLKPTVHQQQQYYIGFNELLIQRLYAAVSDQITQKRWEFQHTNLDPNRLWNIANQVEALNWVSKKLTRILKQYKPVGDSAINLLIASLMRVVTRIDKNLLKFKTNKEKSYAYYRLKSRATIIEWSLFQIHFISTDILERRS
jgi:hypothetical protein